MYSVATCSRNCSSRALLRKELSNTPSPLRVQEFCEASITLVLNWMRRVEYRRIAIIGVDLTSQLHFYSALPRYTHILPLPTFETAIAAFQRVR